MSNTELLAWPFFGYAPGHYSLTCVRCKETHLDWCADKRAISCLECAVIAAKEHIAELEADRTQLDELRAANERLTALLNTPEVEDWAQGVILEVGHQRERWGADHDAGKSPFDWFWLVGYLAQKAAASAVAGDIEKAKHHTISTGAALANWHLALSGVDDRMRPGIDPEREQAA
jgi:hypothetical protein